MKTGLENMKIFIQPNSQNLIHRGQSITNYQLQNALAARDNFRAEIRRTFLDHNIDVWISPSTSVPRQRDWIAQVTRS